MHQKLNSASNVFNHIRSLQQTRKAREKSGRFWIEGIRQFIRAFEAGLEFHTVIASRILLKNHLVEEMMRQLASRGVQELRISPEDFRSISIADRASGIGAIVHQHWRRLESCKAGD